MATFGETTLDGQALVLSDDELLVPLRVPWYRSLPLSCVDAVEVSVNGQAVPRERIRLEVAGHPARGLEELGELTDEFWRVERTGWAQVPAPAGLKVGDRAQVTAVVELHIPYIQISPGVFMPQTASTTRTLEVSER